MFSKGVEFTFEFDPSDDEVRRTIRDSRGMLKCAACGDAAVVAAARALAAAYDAALAAEVRADARARDAALAEGAWVWRSFCATYGAAPAPAPLSLFVRPSRVRDRDRLFVVLAGATLVVTYRRDGDDAGPVAETCVEGYAPGAGGWIGAAARTVDRVPADDAARAAAAAFLAALPARGDAGADLQLLCHAYLHRRDSAPPGGAFSPHRPPGPPRRGRSGRGHPAHVPVRAARRSRLLARRAQYTGNDLFAARPHDRVCNLIAHMLRPERGRGAHAQQPLVRQQREHVLGQRRVGGEPDAAAHLPARPDPRAPARAPAHLRVPARP